MRLPQIIVTAFFAACSAMVPDVSLAEGERCRKSMEFTFMPGDSHVISHKESASRDTALIAYQVIPKVAVTTGGDFGFFGFKFAPVELRLGMFGMFEFSTTGGIGDGVPKDTVFYPIGMK
jgi:hypothetical protein